MIQIGLLSDTHGFIDDRLFTFFDKCDEIWHAGDIGGLETARKLSVFKPLRAVFGNIDDHHTRLEFLEELHFIVENTSVFITHIGGYPGNYAPGIKNKLKQIAPKIFIAGHSHILKVIYDKPFDLMFLNPGAAGNNGFHKVKTALRFAIDGDKLRNMEIWESPRG